MRECKYRKRLQIYLDGWMEEHESKKFEEHLRSCAECQIGMTEIEEINASALEIVDQAPDRAYWDSFYTRVRNRILARNIRPTLEEEKLPRLLTFRLLFASVAILMLAASMLFLLRPVPMPAPAATDQKPLEVKHLSKTGNVVEPTARSTLKTNEALQSTNPMENNAKNPVNTATSGAAANTRFPEKAPAPSVILPENPAMGFAELRQKDIREEFREQTLIGKAELKLEDDYPSAVQALASSPPSIDPIFRLRNSVLTARLLSGLGRDNLGNIAAIYHGPIYSNHASNLNGKGADQENGISTTWGYLRVASDTSRSSEIRRYLIELELMQVK